MMNMCVCVCLFGTREWRESCLPLIDGKRVSRLTTTYTGLVNTAASG